MAHLVHFRSRGMLDLLGLTAPAKARKKKVRPGSWRGHATLTGEQVIEIWRLRQYHGWSATRIGLHLGIPASRCRNVIYGGVGTRTILLKAPI